MFFSSSSNDSCDKDPLYGAKVLPLDLSNPENRKQGLINLLWFSPLILILLFLLLC